MSEENRLIREACYVASQVNILLPSPITEDGKKLISEAVSQLKIGRA
jgi:hypothetical protein